MIFYSKVARLNPEVELAAQRLSTRFAFFGLGFATAAWAPLIPYAQQRLQLNHADFGILLLCTGLGAILAMPTTGLLIYRLGCRLIIGIALAMLMLLLPSLVLGGTALSMAMSLFLFGSAAGALGVAVNFQAVLVEKSSSRPMMSGFHGMCSLGGLAGVLSMTLLLAIGLSPLVSVFIASLILIFISLISVPYGMKVVTKEPVETAAQAPKSKKFSLDKLPSPLVLFIGLICFISFLSEGAAMDWSGIYLTSEYGLHTSFAGLGYTFFAIAMTFGRLFGQNALKFFGENRLIQYSALCSFVGLMTIVLAPHWSVVLAGYALLGLGSSNIVPLMFSRVGRQTRMQKATALSCVSTIAYTGSLAGPALVGIIGQYIGLSTVFTGLAVLLMSVIALNRFSQVESSEQIAHQIQTSEA